VTAILQDTRYCTLKPYTPSQGNGMIGQCVASVELEFNSAPDREALPRSQGAELAGAAGRSARSCCAPGSCRGNAGRPIGSHTPRGRSKTAAAQTEDRTQDVGRAVSVRAKVPRTIAVANLDAEPTAVLHAKRRAKIERTDVPDSADNRSRSSRTRSRAYENGTEG
jgi:hypothetical protein